MKHLQKTLYITEPDVSARLDGEAVCISRKDGGSDHIPLHLLENIVCFSYGEFTQPLLTACARRGIGVSFFTQTGSLRYRIAGPVAGNVLLRKRQYLLSESDSERLPLAAEMLRGKIENQTWLLGRFRRNHPEAASGEREKAEQSLRGIAAELSEVQTEEGLRGAEGNAARMYFRVFDSLILSGETALHFHERSRRPPKDPCNAMLSFAYTLLTTDCIQALTAAGLDPYVGFFHSDRPGKPSLALDIMEELRPLLADRLVLRLINLNIVNEEMFEPAGEGGIYLNSQGRRVFLKEWNLQKQREVFYPLESEDVPQGLLPHLQAQQLARVLRGESDRYRPFRGR